MDTHYIVRGYVKPCCMWFTLSLETPDKDIALAWARSEQDKFRRDKEGNDHPAFDLLEVAATDATGEIIAQWISSPFGYHRVTGR